MESRMIIRCEDWKELHKEFLGDKINIKMMEPVEGEEGYWHVVVRHPETPDGKKLICATLPELKAKILALHKKGKKQKSVQEIWGQFGRIHVNWYAEGRKSEWIKCASEITSKYVDNIVKYFGIQPNESFSNEYFRIPVPQTIYAKH